MFKACVRNAQCPMSWKQRRMRDCSRRSGHTCRQQRAGSERVARTLPQEELAAIEAAGEWEGSQQRLEAPAEALQTACDAANDWLRVRLSSLLARNAVTF